MGWYQGTGAPRVVLRVLRGPRPAPCGYTPGSTCRCANWHRSFTVRITGAFAQGDYLFKLVVRGRTRPTSRSRSGIPKSRATYLLMERTFTEQGWNAFGGYSYYQGEGACTPGSEAYPVCNRARVVSFDRPYDTGSGASDFLGDEYPLVALLRAPRPRRRLRHRRDRRRAPLDRGAPQGAALARPRRAWSYQERVGLDRAMARGSTSSSSGLRRCFGTCGSRRRRSGPTERRSTTATRPRTR